MPPSAPAPAAGLTLKVKPNRVSEWIMPIAAVGLIFVMLVPVAQLSTRHPAGDSA